MMLRSFHFLLIALLLSVAGSCAAEDELGELEGKIITGRVLADHNSRPISGAVVSCGNWSTEADPAGFFTLITPLNKEPGHLYVLRASAPGFGQGIPQVAHDEPMVIRLKKPFEITGVAVDQEGAPVQGVRVRVRGRLDSQSPHLSATFEREGTSEKDGSFKVSGISREVSSQMLTLEAKGYGTTHHPVYITGDFRRAGAEVRDIVLGSAHSIRLTVFGPGNEPMAGTRVSMSGPFKREVEAAEDGVTLFDNLLPGRYHFIAYPLGMARMAALVEVTGEEPTVSAPIGPPPGNALRILVRDATGAPVPGAEVSLGGSVTVPSTGEDGRTIIHGLPERAIKGWVTAPEVSDLFLGIIGPVVPAGQEVVVTLRKKSTVSGRVVPGTGGSPIHATIRLINAGGDTINGGITKSDGSFRIEAPEGVPLKLTAAIRHGPKEGRTKQIPTPTAVGEIPEVTAPAADQQITLRPLTCDRSLTVRLLDPDGAPVAGAEVALNGAIRRPPTDADGKRTWSGLAEWQVQVAARFGAGTVAAVAPAPMNVVPRDQTVELRFRAAVLLRGRLLLPDGSPAPGAEIRLVTADGAISYARSDEEGRFKVAALPGNPHSLSVSHETQKGYRYRAYREGLVPPDKDMEIELYLSAD